MTKISLKEKAILLRKQGKTYTEILKEIPVAKSTISLWFREVNLSKRQKQKITEKRIQGALRGALARKNQRIRIQKDIWSIARREIGTLSKRELWLIGIALYWAEGSKEKEWRHGTGIKFSNSDPKMIRVFLAWVKMFGGISSEKIVFEIYIHESKKADVPAVIKFWSKESGFPKSCFNRIYFKKNKINTKRRNIGDLYKGLVRVKIPQSSALVRKIEGWTIGISKSCGIV